MLRAHLRDGHGARRLEAQGVHGARASSCPTTLVIEMLDDRISQDRRRGAASCSTASRATCRRPRRSTPSWPRHEPQDRRAARARRAGGGDRPAHLRPARLSERAHLARDVQPARHGRRLRHLRRAAHAPRRRRARRRAQPLPPCTSPRPSRCATTTASAARRRPLIDGTGTPDEVYARLRRRARRARDRAQVVARDREADARRAMIVAGDARAARDAARPGVTTGELDRLAERYIRAPRRRRRRSRATAASPARSARRRTT